MMSRDTWVIGTDGSGYTEAESTSHSLSPHAPYELVCQIVGELSNRIDDTGKDGQILVLEVHQGGYLSVDGNNALSFVSGKRKHMPYADWLRQRQRRAELKARRLQYSKHSMTFVRKLAKT